VQRSRRFIAMASAAALTATLAVAIVEGAAGAKPAAGSWKAGDCFAQADVAADEVTLTSKVPCTKDHEVQILKGEALPVGLAQAGVATLTDQTSSERVQLVALQAKVCSPGAGAAFVYPKQAKKLAALMREHDVPGWAPPVPGNTGWVLPEPASFAAGNKDLLCIFHVAADTANHTPADLRKLATHAALGGTRICFDFNAANTGTQAASCADVHDVESLIWIEQPVAGHPDSIADWTEADYSDFDATCQDFGAALVGAKRKDLKMRADTNDTPVSDHGTRLFDCTVYPTADNLRLPAGSIVGTGKAKIAFVKNKT
jgi:hypothetical protein